LHLLLSEASADGEALAARLIQLDGDLLERSRILFRRFVIRRERSNRHDRTAVLGDIGKRLAIGLVAGEKLFHRRSMILVVVPPQSRLLVLEPGEKNMLSTAGLGSFYAQAAGRFLQGFGKVGKLRLLLLVVRGG